MFPALGDLTTLEELSNLTSFVPPVLSIDLVYVAVAAILPDGEKGLFVGGAGTNNIQASGSTQVGEVDLGIRGLRIIEYVI